MIALALVPLMAVLNRFRGGGFGSAYFPGHPRFYTAPLVGFWVWLLMADPLRGFVAAVVYLCWSFLPWGFLASLQHWTPQGRSISWLEARLLDVSRENYLVALGLLHMVGLIPAALSFSLWSPLLAPCFAAAYWAGWRYRPKAPIAMAEGIVGALWALLFIWG